MHGNSCQDSPVASGRGAPDQGDRAAAEGLAQHGSSCAARRAAQAGLWTSVRPRPRLGPYATLLEQLLEEDERLPLKQRRRTARLYEALLAVGYAGKDDSVYRFVKLWRAQRARHSTEVFILSTELES